MPPPSIRCSVCPAVQAELHSKRGAKDPPSAAALRLTTPVWLAPSTVGARAAQQRDVQRTVFRPKWSQHATVLLAIRPCCRCHTMARCATCCGPTQRMEWMAGASRRAVQVRVACLLAARCGLPAVVGSGEEDGAAAAAVLLCSCGEEGGSM